MKSPIHIFSAAVILAFSGLESQGAVLANYQFGTPGSETTMESGPAYGPTTSALNLTASSISDPASTIGLEISSAATTPAGAPFLRIDPLGNSASAGAAVTGNKYFQFSLTADLNFRMDLTSLTFNAARGGGGTPRGYVVRSSVDAFSTNLDTADLLTARPTYTPVSLNLSSPGFQNLNTITFRIYSYSPGGGSSVDYDDIVVNGAVSAIPEPSAAGLMAMGVIALAGRRRVAGTKCQA